MRNKKEVVIISTFYIYNSKHLHSILMMKYGCLIKLDRDKQRDCFTGQELLNNDQCVFKA